MLPVQQKISVEQERKGWNKPPGKSTSSMCFQIYYCLYIKLANLIKAFSMSYCNKNAWHGNNNICEGVITKHSINAYLIVTIQMHPSCLSPSFLKICPEMRSHLPSYHSTSLIVYCSHTIPSFPAQHCSTPFEIPEGIFLHVQVLQICSYSVICEKPHKSHA